MVWGECIKHSSDISLLFSNPCTENRPHGDKYRELIGKHDTSKTNEGGADNQKCGRNTQRKEGITPRTCKKKITSHKYFPLL